MVSMPDLAGTSSMDLERPSTNWTDTVLFAKNFSFVPIAGHFKSCYANHVFGRREDGPHNVYEVLQPLHRHYGGRLHLYRTQIKESQAVFGLALI